MTHLLRIDVSPRGTDFVRPFMDFVLRFVGFASVDFITLDGTNAGPEALAASQAAAQIQLAALVPELSHAG